MRTIWPERWLLRAYKTAPHLFRQSAPWRGKLWRTDVRTHRQTRCSICTSYPSGTLVGGETVQRFTCSYVPMNVFNSLHSHWPFQRIKIYRNWFCKLILQYSVSPAESRTDNCWSCYLKSLSLIMIKGLITLLFHITGLLYTSQMAYAAEYISYAFRNV